jgi:truncated hemoglobin YjbI
MGDLEETPTLYEWAGGREAFRGLIEAFYDRVERDELISPFFPGGVGREHRDHVVLWWSEVFGGPSDYTEQLGGYPRMLGRHRNLGINPEQRLRFTSLMSLAADDAGLPTTPSFAPPSWRTWNGERGSPCRIPSLARLRRRRLRSPDGAGASPRRISPEARPER